MTHRLIVGSSGGGKTQSLAWDFGPAQVLLDCHNRGAAHLLAGHMVGSKKDFVMDRLINSEYVLPLELLRPSKKSGLAGELEDEQARKTLIEMMGRARGVMSLIDKPLTYEWIYALLEMWQSQRNPKPPMEVMAELFDIGSPVRDSLIINSKDDRLRRKFGGLKSMNPNARRNEVGAAERLWNSTFRSPVLKSRINGKFDFVKFLNRGGVIAVEGGGVSEDDKKLVLGAWSVAVIRAATNGEFTRPVTLIIDEFPVIIGPVEASGLPQVRKYDLNIWLSGQSLALPPEIVEAIVQNCEVESFRCNSADTARQVAEILGTYGWDRDEIADRRTSVRQFHNGYDHDGKADYRLEDEVHEQKKHSSVFIKETQQDLMRLKTGWRIVKTRKGIKKEYVPLKRRRYPWASLQEKKTEELIRKSIMKHGMKPSSNSSTFTPATSVFSNMSSTKKSGKGVTSKLPKVFRGSKGKKNASSSDGSKSNKKGGR